MSPLGELAAGAVAGIWKIAAIVLAAALLMVLSAAGTGWWAIAGARDQALADLHAEQGITTQLRGAIQLQNSVVEASAAAKAAAEARGQAAQQQAAAAGRRFDAALAKVAGARATTCDEAMPTVNTILEATR
ncbi:hypothetical protein F2P44_04025 [Massilia sp. CCM 8695]|uniref:Uncharacterized protein n=1 Tax=Massilia frigida TaxID=2609281 RepID=A0ABX0N9K5_9BURK|nr:hypothetical protein [Massilia frigida]NHZ78455.1 hypothetical protein [Massilia frigida]